MEEDHGRSGAARAPAGAPGASAAGEAIGAARPTAMLLAALGATLALLLAHAWLYRFLTDDAFISFRYSVNLAHGHGLVFNPGWEPVEGYSNFLWVLLLAGLDVLGMRPETISVPLSFLCTLALGAIVAHFAWRQSSSREPLWIMVVPGLLLAVTRSVAVWSSSGLETRFFELLIVAGALRMVAEVESHERAAPRMPLAPSAFALATLTRPDGLLLSLSAFGAAGLYLASRSPRALPRFVAGLAPFALLVGAHYAFRHAYYGDWLPNTYYAKVDGQTWWSSGFAYLSAFAIEYAVPLWLPFLAAGVVACARRGRAFVPLLFAALVVPHALYVASIGGDHFEYRPVDLYFPFAFLLMGSGAGWLAMGGASAPAPHHVESPATNRARSLAVAAGLLIVVVGLWDLPWQSHRQFPDHYITGFPGVPIQHDAEAQAFLDPARDPIYCTPPLRPLAESFRARLRDLTANFVGVRQEEHRLFLETVSPEGRRIHELIDQGVLPRDVYIAMGSVGAIPYYSGARVLDRVGLTDAHGAHS
ncbi:MAG: hypothetical protein HYR73_01420, partial [Candidatus Eisenbacteria bacterium]|nr:hypothetical protein [Candidatus Eisenbacteria bacterium]